MSNLQNHFEKGGEVQMDKTTILDFHATLGEFFSRLQKMPSSLIKSYAKLIELKVPHPILTEKILSQKERYSKIVKDVENLPVLVNTCFSIIDTKSYHVLRELCNACETIHFDDFSLTLNEYLNKKLTFDNLVIESYSDQIIDSVKTDDPLEIAKLFNIELGKQNNVNLVEVLANPDNVNSYTLGVALASTVLILRGVHKRTTLFVDYVAIDEGLQNPSWFSSLAILLVPYESVLVASLLYEILEEVV